MTPTATEIPKASGSDQGTIYNEHGMHVLSGGCRE